MKQYRDVCIYTEEDFDEKLTIYEAQQLLEQQGIERPCVIIFGKYIGGHCLALGKNTRTVADIMIAEYAMTEKA